MKIGLVKINQRTQGLDPEFNMPPLGIAYIAAILQRQGYLVKILDARVSSPEEIDDFLAIDFDIVGFSLVSFELDESLAFLDRLKAKNRKAIIVFGGPHIDVVGADILANEKIEYAVFGEGEFTMLDLARLIELRRQPSLEQLQQIKGLIFRAADRTVVKNPPGDFIADLDRLPFPALNLIDADRYAYHAISSSRGCPFNCCFCYHTLAGKKWRPRSAQSVADEIEFILGNFGKKRFFFCDDNFSLEQPRIEAICAEIIKRNLKIKWFVGGMRAEGIRLDLLNKMKQAGCDGFSMGIESADPEVFVRIGKGESLEDIERALTFCQQAELEVWPHFMIGNPTETLRSVKQTGEFIKRFNLYNAAIYLALPYPKTRLWDYVEKQGRWLDRQYQRYNHFSPSPVFDTPEFSVRERVQALNYVKRVKKALQRKKLLKEYLNRLKARIDKAFLFILHPLRFISFYRRVWAYYYGLMVKQSPPQAARHIQLLKMNGCPFEQTETEKFFMGKMVIAMLHIMENNLRLHRKIKQAMKTDSVTVKNRKDKMVVVNFAPLRFPPTNGGEMRFYHLYHSLSKYYDISLLDIATDSREQRTFSDHGLKELLLPRSRIFDHLHRLFSDSQLSEGIYGTISSITTFWNRAYRKALGKLMPEADILISERVYLFPYLRRLRKNQLLIYNAHNVEHLYQNKVLRNSLLGRLLVKYLTYLETKACRSCDIILATCEEDKQKLSSLYKITPDKIYLVPNGIDTLQIKPCSGDEKQQAKRQLCLPGKKTILFIGNNYLPNIEASRFLVFQLAPRLRDYTFLVAGGVGEGLLERYQKSLWPKLKMNFPPKIFLGHAAALGRGWHNLWYLQNEGIAFRWSKKEAYFYLEDAQIAQVEMEARCPRQIETEVFANGIKIGQFKAEKKWRKFEFAVPAQAKLILSLRVERTWSHRLSFQSMQFGVGVKSISYLTKEGEKKLDLIREPVCFCTLDNLLFFGKVTDQQKKIIFKASDIAVNPMFSGSGTNIKVLDYMAAGIPVVSSKTGARGLAVENHQHLIISDTEDFLDHIECLSNNGNDQIIRAKARRLVEDKYDWEKIAGQLNAQLKNLSMKGPLG